MKKLDQEESQENNEIVMGTVEIPEIRILSLCGTIDERKASAITYSLHAYSRIQREDISKDNKKTKYVVDPVEFHISTYGGSALEMFAIYDTMRMTKKNMTIKTLGSGKVMSAGVLLLAAGTKGHRMAGRNCRIMLHAVQAGTAGSSHDIQNEVAEILFTQKRYIDCLAKETNQKVTVIKELMEQKRNVYLSSTEAVKYGIIDKII